MKSPVFYKGLAIVSLLPIIGILANEALAQDSSGRFITNKGRSYFYRAWTRESGLPQDMVADVVQTPDGFLWFTTFGGLVRFDGVELRVFDVAGEAGLLSNSMTALYSDRLNTLWIGHNVEGLNRYEDGQFTIPSGQGSLPSGKVWAITEDHEGVLWVGTRDGLFSLRAGMPRLGPKGLPDGPVLALYADRQGGLWAGTADGLWYRSPGPTHFNRVDGAPRVAVHSIAIDADGLLWLGTELGLVRRRRGWEVVVDSSCRHTDWSAPTVARVLLDGRGLWFSPCSNREIPEATRLFHLSRSQLDAPLPLKPEIIELGGLSVTALRVDREGVLWLGTQGQGIYSLQQQPVKRWTVEDGLLTRELRVVIADGEGGMWVAGDCDTPLTHFREGVITPHPTDAAGRDLSCVGALLRSRDGDLWIGSSGDLVRLRSGLVIERQVVVEGAEGTAINALLEDLDGLWIGCDGHGLARWAGGELTFFTKGDGLPSNSVRFLLNDRAGDLWIGTNKGLSHLKGGRITSYSKADGLPPGMVRAIHEDPDGSLWIGTYGGGLARFRDGTFQRLTMEHGLFDNVVTRILEDDHGRVWMLGNLGLSYVQRHQLHAVADGELAALNPVTFGVAEGMIEGSGARQPAGSRTADGRMWFPTIDGLAMIDADGFRPDELPPPIHIEKLVIDGRAISPGDELLVAAGERDLEIHYTAPSFLSPGKVRFRYLLEGHDEDWHSAGTRRVAYYSSLPPGTYSFRVSAANRHGIWNEKGASARLRVEPPLWRTWWALASYFFAAGALLVGAFKWHRRRIERERAVSRRLRQVDRLKDEFLATTSHELRTPLYGMVGLAEALIDGVGGVPSDTARKHLNAVVASGRRLSALVDDILDFSKLRHGNLQLDLQPMDLRAAVDVVLTLCRSLAVGRDLELLNRVEPDIPPAMADENRVQQILYNLVGNAVKFTENGTVEVSAQLRGEVLEVAVSDSGVGIESDQIERIFGVFEQGDASVSRAHGGSGLGLAITRRLVELHGGQLHVESTPGRGSTFYFSLSPAAEDEKLSSVRSSTGQGSAAWTPPVSRAAEQASIGASPEPTESSGGFIEPRAERKGEQVLVVDDEPVIREVLVSQLHARGYLAETASGGEEAIEKIKTGSFDLVLLDVMMPRISGYEVCRAVRRIYSAQELPVIFLTAKTRIAERVAGLAEGANDYLSKPVSKDELLARVETHLDLLKANRRLGDLLEDRTEQVQILSGLLPICAECKKVRDDEGYWGQIEVFLSSHSELEFSHGLCPQCLEGFMVEAEAGGPDAGPPD